MVLWRHLVVWAERVLAPVGGGGAGGGVSTRRERKPLQVSRRVGWSRADDLSRWHREDYWNWRGRIPVDQQDLDGCRVAPQVHLVLLTTLTLKTLIWGNIYSHSTKTECVMCLNVDGLLIESCKCARGKIFLTYRWLDPMFGHWLEPEKQFFIILLFNNHLLK